MKKFKVNNIIINFITLFFACFVISCSKFQINEINNSKQNDKIIVGAEIIENNIDNSKVSITLKNNTTQNIYVWTMSCGYDESFVTNNIYVKIIGKECDKNIPLYFTLKPQEKKIYKLNVYKNNSTINNLKIGFKTFNDISKLDLKFDYLNQKENNKKDYKIYWSNELSL